MFLIPSHSSRVPGRGGFRAWCFSVVFEWLDLSSSPFSFSVLGLGRVVVHSVANQSESVGDLGPSELFDAEMYTQLSVVQLCNEISSGKVTSGSG